MHHHSRIMSSSEPQDSAAAAAEAVVAGGPDAQTGSGAVVAMATGDGGASAAGVGGVGGVGERTVTPPPTRPSAGPSRVHRRSSHSGTGADAMPPPVGMGGVGAASGVWGTLPSCFVLFVCFSPLIVCSGGPMKVLWSTPVALRYPPSPHLGTVLPSCALLSCEPRLTN